MNFLKKNLKLILPLLFMGLAVSSISLSIKDKKRVLVVNSYHPEYAWTRDLKTGFERRFEGNHKATVKHYYMDTKRFSDPESKRKAATSATNEIDRWQPDVIVTFDDDAQKLVGTKFLNHPGISIVYAGVNNDPATYGYFEADNVYGIKENMLLRAFWDTLSDSELFKKRHKPVRIAHLSDSSSQSASVIKDVRSYDWDPHKIVFSLECKTFEEWKAGLKRAGREADVLFITNYHTLLPSREENNNPDDTSVKAKKQSSVRGPEVMKWASENTTIPIFGAWGFTVEDGGMISLAVSPFEQGEAAAEFANSIIRGEYIPDDKRHVLNEEVLVYIRKSRMNKWNWKLPNIYTSYARATGNLYP